MFFISFAVAHRLCYEVKVRTLCGMFCKGYSLQGNRERTKTQEYCFGATEPLDESNSVKLFRFLCDVISALWDTEARSYYRFLTVDTAVSKATDVPDWKQLGQVYTALNWGRETLLDSGWEAPLPQSFTYEHLGVKSSHTHAAFSDLPQALPTYLNLKQLRTRE